MSDEIKTNYPSNSRMTRGVDGEKERKVEKVISGEVVQRKQPLGRKIAETFSGDDMQSVGQFILFDVVIPAAKDLMFDAFTQGMQRKLYGEGTRRGTTSRPGGGRYTNYNKISSSTEDRFGSRQISKQARANHNFDEVILENRGEAEEVLERMSDLISEYDVASVADLYEMVGITGSFTDVKYGWTSVAGSRVVRVRDGYLLDLPKPGPLD